MTTALPVPVAVIPLLDRQVGDSITAVDARELHRGLESRQDFSTWFKARVDQLGLVAGVDFEKINDSASTNLGSANRIDYAVGLDAAKHIAMAERTEAGRRVRAYFIACEKQLRARPTPATDAVLSDPAALRTLLLGYTEKVLALEERVGELEPKAAFVDSFVEADGLYGLQNAGRALGMKPNRFIDQLKREHLFYQGRELIPRQRYVEQGLFVVRVWTDRRPDGDRARLRTFVTPKGLEVFGRTIALERTAGAA